MISRNRVDIMGYLGRAPELKYTNGGDAALKFSVAATEKWKDKDGVTPREKTTWFRCVLYGKRAEGLAKILKQGAPVAVEGSISTYEYEKDGVKHYGWEVRVIDLQLLAPKPADGSSSSASDDGDYRPARDFDDDIPF